MSGSTLEVAIATRTTPEGERFYRIGLPRGQIEVRPLCDDLAALALVKRVADDSWPWIPPLVDVGGSVVEADNPAQHFTGDLKLAWNGGGATAGLILDRARLKLDTVRLKDEAMGRLDGGLTVNLMDNIVDVTAATWHPGPRIPLPAKIPVDAILAVMPQASMHLEPQPVGWSVRRGAVRDRARRPSPGSPTRRWTSREPACRCRCSSRSCPARSTWRPAGR